MAQPTVRDVRPVDPVLTNLSIGFKNEKFLWDKIAPPSEQSQQSGTFFLYTRDFWFRRQKGMVRAEDGTYLPVGFGVATDSYKTIEYGAEKLVADSVRKASETPEDLETVSTAFLTNLMQLELEKVVAATCFVTGVWGTSTTLAGVNQWSDFDNSDPIANADTAMRVVRRNTGAKPNTLFVGLLGWEKLKEHPLILDKYKHTQKGILTEELVAAALGVERLVVGDSVENTAAEGGAFAGADIWTDNALLVVQNAPALEVATGAVTFMWDEAGNIPWAAQEYREEQTRSDVQRVFAHYVPKVVSAQHGYLFLDVVA